MDKMVTVNQKRANKQQQPRPKKKGGPLKVVYITNPIKFKTSASEFRALVQELTGQDSDVPESSRFAAADGVGGDAAKVAAEDNIVVHAGEESTVTTKLGHSTCDGDEVGVEIGSDPLTFGSCDDYCYDGNSAFCSPQIMMENFQGLMASNYVWHETDAMLSNN